MHKLYQNNIKTISKTISDNLTASWIFQSLLRSWHLGGSMLRRSFFRIRKCRKPPRIQKGIGWDRWVTPLASWGHLGVRLLWCTVLISFGQRSDLGSPTSYGIVTSFNHQTLGQHSTSVVWSTSGGSLFSPSMQMRQCFTNNKFHWSLATRSPKVANLDRIDSTKSGATEKSVTLEMLGYRESISKPWKMDQDGLVTWRVPNFKGRHLTYSYLVHPNP